MRSFSMASALKSLEIIEKKKRPAVRLTFRGEGPFGAAVWAPPIRRWTTGRRDVSAPDIWAPFPNLFSSYEEKTMKQAIP